MVVVVDDDDDDEDDDSVNDGFGDDFLPKILSMEKFSCVESFVLDGFEEGLSETIK